MTFADRSSAQARAQDVGMTAHARYPQHGARRNISGVFGRQFSRALFQQSGETSLTARVVRAGRTDRYAHDFGRGLEGEVLVKDKVKNFPLPTRKLGERPVHNGDALGVSGIRAGFGRRLVLFFLGKSLEAQPADPPPSSFLRGSVANDGEKPCAERGATAVTCAALQDFLVSILKNIGGVAGMGSRATEGPAVGRLMVKLEQVRQIFAAVAFFRSASVFFIHHISELRPLPI